MFLEAARRMEVAPRDCLVLEDSKAGFEAAAAAGMDLAIVSRL
jgi:HAD superfamily hydrolase (TIGR01509 family)